MSNLTSSYSLPREQFLDIPFADFTLLNFIVSQAGYEPTELRISNDVIIRELNFSKNALKASFTSLEKAGLLVINKDSKGRRISFSLHHSLAPAGNNQPSQTKQASNKPKNDALSTGEPSQSQGVALPAGKPSKPKGVQLPSGQFASASESGFSVEFNTAKKNKYPNFVELLNQAEQHRAFLRDYRKEHEEIAFFSESSKSGLHIILPSLYMCAKEIKDSFPLKDYMSDFFNKPTKIDLAPMMEAAGLSKTLKPFGQDHNWLFDFSFIGKVISPFADQIKANIENNPDNDIYSFTHERFNESWKQFFIFTLCVELANFTHECFLDVDGLNRKGDNLKEFWGSKDQGILVECLKACIPNTDQTSGGYLLPAYFIESKVKRYDPTKGSFIAFILACLRFEVITLLNKPDTAELCFNRFKRIFVGYVNEQRFIRSSKHYPVNSPDWLSGLWTELHTGLLAPRYAEVNSPLLSKSSPCLRPYTAFIPRLSFPLILFRHLVACELISSAYPYNSKEKQIMCISFLRHSFVMSQLMNLASLIEVLAPHFPFFNKLNISKLEADYGNVDFLV